MSTIPVCGLQYYVIIIDKIILNEVRRTNNIITILCTLVSCNTDSEQCHVLNLSITVKKNIATGFNFVNLGGPK